MWYWLYVIQQIVPKCQNPLRISLVIFVSRLMILKFYIARHSHDVMYRTEVDPNGHMTQ